MATLFDEEVVDLPNPNYVFIDTNEKLEYHLNNITSLDVIALDTETQGLDYHLDNLLLLQLGDDEVSYVIDPRPGKVDIVPYLKEYLEDPSIVKIGHNLQFDYSMLKVQRGIDMRGMHCLMIGEQVVSAGVDPTMSYKLSAVVKRRLGITLEKNTVVTFIGHPIDAPFSEKQIFYAARDTLVLPELYTQQLVRIKKYGLEKTVKLEMDCIPHVASTILYGCNIDFNGWHMILEHSGLLEAQVAMDILEVFSDVASQQTLFGTPNVNLNSQKQLVMYLNRLGVPVEDTQASTLEDMSDMHPVIGMILEYRGYEKIRSAYGEKLLNKQHKVTGRIHPNFNQARAATGRMSSNNPNFQQIIRPRAFHKKIFEINPPDDEYDEVFRMFKEYKDAGGPMPQVHRTTKEEGGLSYKDKYFKLGNIVIRGKEYNPKADIYIDSVGNFYKYVPDFRECFTAPEGYKIIQADFSQCIHEEELVAHPSGILPLRQMTWGSQVVNTSHVEDGCKSEGFVEAYKSKGVKECVVVKDETGRETTSTLDHRFLVCSGFGQYEWVEARNLKEGDWLVSARDWIRRGTFDDDEVLRAEFAGMWVGDGSYCSGGVQIAKGEDSDVFNVLTMISEKLFSKPMKNYPNTNSWDLIGLDIKKELQGAWGLNKGSALTASFPERFMVGGREAIAAMLRGYFEADGTVNATEELCVVYSTTYSKTLAQQTQLLLLGLGIQSKIFSREEETNFGSGICYRVQIRGLEDLMKYKEEVGFISSRKSNLLGEAVRLSAYKTKTSVDMIPFVSEKIVQWYKGWGVRDNNFYSKHVKNLVGSDLPHRPRRYVQKFILDAMQHNQPTGDLNLLCELDDLVHSSNGLCFSRADSIMDAGVLPVADIAVTGSPSFVAGGHVVHNCELRILAALSGDPKMLKTYHDNGDIHTATSLEVFGTDDPEYRNIAKTINFGIAYGQTAWGLSRTINRPETESQQILDKFKEKFPTLTRWLAKTGTECFTQGYSDTAIGRRRWLVFDIDPNKFPEEAERLRRRLERQGTNHKIQGANADVTKLSLIYIMDAIAERGYDAHNMIIVHDEFVMEVVEEQAETVARLVEEQMSRAFTDIFPQVPMPCTAQIGDHWLK